MKNLFNFYISFYYVLGQWLVRLIFIPIVILIFVSVFVVATNGDSIAKYSVYVIESESMEPYLYRGDVIVIKKVESYVLKDVVTYESPNEKNVTYTHRIVKKQTTPNGVVFFETKGDNNEKPDSFSVFSSQIKGKTVQTFSQVGQLVLFLRSYVGVVVFIVIPSTMLVTLYLVDISHWFQKKHKESLF